MANSTLDSELFILQDVWPGKGERVAEPGGNITNTTDHNVAAATHKVGEKIWLYNESAGVSGWSAFMYLQVGTQNASSAIAVKSICVPDSATVWYQVTNDPDDCVKVPTNMLAVALSAMTDAYYGFFWVGGVCPEEYVSGLGGNYATDGSVAAGGILAHDGTADYIVLGPISAVKEPPAGFALAADA